MHGIRHEYFRPPEILGHGGAAVGIGQKGGSLHKRLGGHEMPSKIHDGLFIDPDGPGCLGRSAITAVCIKRGQKFQDTVLLAHVPASGQGGK